MSKARSTLARKRFTPEKSSGERTFTRSEIRDLLWFFLSNDDGLVDAKTKNKIESEINELFGSAND